MKKVGLKWLFLLGMVVGGCAVQTAQPGGDSGRFERPVSSSGIVGVTVVPPADVKPPPPVSVFCDHEHSSTWCIGIDNGARCIQSGPALGGANWVCGCFQDSDCVTGACSYDFDLGQYACRM